jgi:hypothetical protein
MKTLLLMLAFVQYPTKNEAVQLNNQLFQQLRHKQVKARLALSDIVPAVPGANTKNDGPAWACEDPKRAVHTAENGAKVCVLKPAARKGRRKR